MHYLRLPPSSKQGTKTHCHSNRLGHLLLLVCILSLCCTKQEAFSKCSRRSREVSISSVMTDGSELIMVTPITKLRTCLKLMVNMNLRRLPVINGPNEIVGLLSMLDIINDSIAHEGPSSEPEYSS